MSFKYIRIFNIYRRRRMGLSGIVRKLGEKILKNEEQSLPFQRNIL